MTMMSAMHNTTIKLLNTFLIDLNLPKNKITIKYGLIFFSTYLFKSVVMLRILPMRPMTLVAHVITPKIRDENGICKQSIYP